MHPGVQRPSRSKMHVCIKVGSLLFTVWLLWALLPAKIFGFLPGYPQANLRRNWIRVRFGFQASADARRAAARARYQVRQSAWPPPLYVVALRSAIERRASVRKQMGAQKIAFRWWDAVDGKALPEDEIRWYTSGRRLAIFLRTQPGSQPHRKLACDLSHLRLMHSMVAAGREIQVVLEDDVQLVGDDFLGQLNATLSTLPDDWDVLWLNHGGPIARRPGNLAGWVGPRARMFWDNSGTVGMVYRRKFALVVSALQRAGRLLL